MSLQGAGLRSDRGLDVRLVRFYNRADAEEPAMLAEDLLAAGRCLEAVQVVEIGLEIDSSDAEIMVTGARAWLEEGAIDRAQLLLTRAASAEPAWSEPWKRLGELLLERGRFDKAARILERARALEPADPQLDGAWRRAERRQGIDARLSRFERTPDREEPVMLAKDLLREGRVEDARRVTRRALEIDAEDGELWLAHAQVCAAMGDRAAERQSLAEATAADPGWVEAWHRWLGALMEDEQVEDARESVMRALEHHPTDSKLVCLRMQIEEMLDCDDEPEVSVEPVVEAAPAIIEVPAAVEEPVVVVADLEPAEEAAAHVEPEPPSAEDASADDTWADLELVLPAVRIKRRAPEAPAVVAQPPVVVAGQRPSAFDDDPELDALLSQLERETIVPSFRDTLPGIAAPCTEDAPYAFGVFRPRRDNGLRATAGRRPYYPPSPTELYPSDPEPGEDADRWAQVG